MKTSSKIFVATLLLLFGSLTAYNMALRHEFRQGTYKDPLHNYTTLALRDFALFLIPRTANSRFALFGGVRFGGAITADDAFAMGFDHIALAAGAGRPTMLELPNGLARGVRAASDFLMALQLTGAAKINSIANMQLRLPVVVIGGGLTAIDTATEALAYYPVQVEKFLSRYEILVREKSEEAVRARFTQEEIEIADEFIYHAQELREERTAAQHQGRAPNFIALLKLWGGVTIAYRKRLIDSPSYTLNHEEVELGMQEGIVFAEGLTPKRIEIDQYGHARSIRMTIMEHEQDGSWTSGPDVELNARAILIAAGTHPNTVLAREDSDNFVLDGKYFQAVDRDGNVVKPARALAKPGMVHVLLSKRADHRFMSFFGDLHPSFAGNVVILTARRIFPSGSEKPKLAGASVTAASSIVIMVLSTPAGASLTEATWIVATAVLEFRSPSLTVTLIRRSVVLGLLDVLAKRIASMAVV